MLMKTPEVKIRVPGYPLGPRAALATRVIIIANYWLNSAGGITTAAKAAAVADVSVPLVDAARIVLQSGDEGLLTQVMNGDISLTAAANIFRRRVRLIESFKAASADDRAALGRMVGTATVFDDVIMPAL